MGSANYYLRYLRCLRICYVFLFSVLYMLHHVCFCVASIHLTYTIMCTQRTSSPFVPSHHQRVKKTSLPLSSVAILAPLATTVSLTLMALFEGHPEIARWPYVCPTPISYLRLFRSFEYLVKWDPSMSPVWLTFAHLRVLLMLDLSWYSQSVTGSPPKPHLQGVS